MINSLLNPPLTYRNIHIWAIVTMRSIRRRLIGTDYRRWQMLCTQLKTVVSMFQTHLNSDESDDFEPSQLSEIASDGVAEFVEHLDVFPFKESQRFLVSFVFSTF